MSEAKISKEEFSRRTQLLQEKKSKLCDLFTKATEGFTEAAQRNNPPTQVDLLAMQLHHSTMTVLSGAMKKHDAVLIGLKTALETWDPNFDNLSLLLAAERYVG